MATPDAIAPADPLIGTVVGDRYRITGLLGTGGMGTVYRAEHVIIGKAVALKVLRHFGDNSVVARRFEREAFATGRIEHPNCVTASDGGQLEDGRLFLAMELVDGDGLSEVLATERRLPVARAIRITAHVLRGLAFAHRADVVHRDIKPENIVLVEANGDRDFAKILDFGIAKLLDDSELEVDEQKATQIGTTIGTPTYMSPEQAFGQRVDGRADLYSTAVMLFEMIAGRPPFVAEDNAALLSMHVRDPVPAIAAVSPEVSVPPELDRLIRDAMAKERRDRISSAEKFLERLGEVERIVLARPPEPDASGRTPIPGVERSSPPITAPVMAAPTPSAAVALPRPSRRWSGRRIAALSAAVLAVLGLLALAGGGDGDAPVSPPGITGAKMSLPVPSPRSGAAAEAREMYDDGHHDAVIAYLEAKRAEIASDPAALLLLGHSYAKTEQLDKALSTYQAAAEVHPAVGDDAEVAAAVRAALGSRRRSDREAAQKLVAQLLKRSRAGALRSLLVELAVDDKQMSLRQWARGLAREYNVDGLDLLGSLALDLDQERSCADRKKVVGEIAALRDERAIPILEAARTRVRRAGFFRRRRNTNSCLTEDIDRAIAQLRTH